MQITEADIAGMNRKFVTRAAAFARRAGACIVILGALALAAWGWNTVRFQQQLGDSCSDSSPLGIVDGGDCVGALRRTDALAAGFSTAALAAATIGIGFTMRLLADYSDARTGGSISGFQPGDQIEVSGDLADDDFDESVQEPGSS